MSLEIKEAIRLAIGVVNESFEGQRIENVLLEEVEDDDAGGWLITVGFDRHMESRATPGTLASIAQRFIKERKYKIVKITSDGKVKSIKDRMLDK
ncbi:hypothetical protein OKW98_16705 [Pseudomonas sp. KU26590]|uniref:hypothetical protein n=1 Tax=Pseudomonas sp. KU26590 TaxID=2991051 RepID=UPI00223CEB8B|nr:hypothetical protein [Pseudomonas sp. KU26590]UZJ58243.1 hypothetical protein OKW98_16705 [Pseudomonas sp. KU26590]